MHPPAPHSRAVKSCALRLDSRPEGERIGLHVIDDLLSGATPTVPFRVFHLLADLSLRPSLTSPHKGPVIPKMIPPSTCALTVSGLTTVPQSTAQTMGARGFPLPWIL